jgi:hypothetical protein
VYTDDGQVHEARVEFAIARAAAAQPSRPSSVPPAPMGGGVSPAVGPTLAGVP